MFGRHPVTPVVYLDRHRKAQMVESIMQSFLGGPVAGYRVLDIGCGNGDISTYFARRNEQFGVDVSDRRKEANHNFRFSVVDSERLPYPDGYFDIVMSHHVIEHVEDQDLHLAEIRRVLKPSGIVYLATPNRSSPLMKGHVGNEQVLRYHQVEPLLERNGFSCTDFSPRVVKEPDRYFSDMRLGRLVPMPLIRLLRPFIPSHIYMLRPQ
jgi:ubiquinone/menaquinone biosynthesis C-methylase UbiE